MQHSNLYKTKIVRLGKIKIPPEFQLTPPGAQKIKRKYLFFVSKHRFASPVMVDRTYTLVDGYTTYLLARMFGCKKIEIRIVPHPDTIPQTQKKEGTQTDE